jgi:protein-S-isoprenylcysteine O-methyltransferase Ste14
MWVWLVIAALFLFLLGRQLHENTSGTRSRPAALLGTLADGLGLIALGIGVFGVLMAIFLGVFAGAGPHLTGNSLRDVILWSAGFLALGIALIVASGAIRRLGGRGAPVARPTRGGH